MDKGAAVLSLPDDVVTEDALAPRLVVSRSLLSYVDAFDTLEVVNTGAEPEPSPDPTPDPTTQPSLSELIQQMINGFVRSLFDSISRLFGN